MSNLCKNKCGRQTHNPSGICAICNLKANDPDTIQRSGDSLRPMGGQGSGGTEDAVRSAESLVPEDRQCSIKGCSKFYVKDKLCTKHFREKHGKPAFANSTKEKGPKQSRREGVTVTKKICCDCKKEYKPTSNVQKRCPECKKSINHQPSSVNCKIESCKNPIKTQGLCNKHYLQKLKNEGRIGIRKTPSTSLDGKKSQVSWKRKWAGNGNIGADRSSVAEPERKQLDIRRCRICGCTDNDCSKCIERTGEPCHWVEDDLCSACQDNKPTGSQKGNGYLAQMLYASDQLDKQINSVLEDGSIDTKVILDIRFRLGEVVRGSIPA